MQDQLSTDDVRENLRPLVDASIQLIDRMHAQFGAPLGESSIRLSRARAHGAAKTASPMAFLTECVNYIGTLRGLYKMRKIAYPARPLENELFELFKTYRVAHILITSKETPLW